MMRLPRHGFCCFRQFSNAVSRNVSMRTIKSDTLPLSESTSATSKCGPEQEIRDEKVNVQNSLTGEILGPTGKEPTRYNGTASFQF